MNISIDKKIRIELIKKGITGGEIARKIGVHRNAINKTIKGEIKSYRLRKAIAKAIGKTVEDLWSVE